MNEKEFKESEFYPIIQQYLEDRDYTAKITEGKEDEKISGRIPDIIDST